MAKGSAYVNPDGTFRGGFDGCMGHFMKSQGLPEENARKLCAYIGRRAGRIATDGAPSDTLEGAVGGSPACLFADGLWIEVFRAGDYGEKGRYTEADLDRLAADYDPALHEAPVVIGHPENDKPAYGWVGALRREGNILLAYVIPTVQEFVDAVRKGLFKKISVGLFKLKETGRTYLRHVGFLGAGVPEVKGLAPVALTAGEPFVAFETGDLGTPLATAVEQTAAEARRRAVIEEFYSRCLRILYSDMIPDRRAAILEQLDQLQAVLEDMDFAEPEKEETMEKKTFTEWLRDGLREVGLLKETPTLPAQFTEAQVKEREEAAAKRGRDEATAAGAKTARAAAVKAEVAAFVDAGIKAGTFLPAWRDAGIPAVLERAMLDETEIAFAEGKPARKAGEILMELFKGLPKLVNFAEIAKGQGQDPDATLKAEFAAGRAVHDQLGVTFETFKKHKAAKAA